MCIAKNSSKLFSREDLISVFKKILPEDHPCVTEGVTTIGLVGYPNVGKSSTINSILQDKKVSVSATPGKTKHFQVRNLICFLYFKLKFKLKQSLYMGM